MVSPPTVKAVDSPDFMDLREFAERTQTGLTTAYVRAQAGKLEVPVRKVGRQYRIPRAAYDAWVSGQEPSAFNPSK